jgi:hypothetical protein
MSIRCIYLKLFLVVIMFYGASSYADNKSPNLFDLSKIDAQLPGIADHENPILRSALFFGGLGVALTGAVFLANSFRAANGGLMGIVLSLCTAAPGVVLFVGGLASMYTAARAPTCQTV